MIITLVGSARFEREFHNWNKALSMTGHVVFSLATFPSVEGGKDWYTDDEKRRLDATYIEKIRLSDAILILNKHAYIGAGGLRELEFAQKEGKTIYALESWGSGNGVLPGMHVESCMRSKNAAGIPLEYVSPISTADFKWSCDLLGPQGDHRRRMVDMVR